MPHDQSSELRWNEPPAERLAAWNAIFDPFRPVTTFPDPCPICGSRTLHQWLLVYRLSDETLNGIHYRGRGSWWQWCSTCRHCTHASSAVPDWWFEPMQVDKAAHVPTLSHIEQSIDRRLRHEGRLEELDTPRL